MHGGIDHLSRPAGSATNDVIWLPPRPTALRLAPCRAVPGQPHCGRAAPGRARSRVDPPPAVAYSIPGRASQTLDARLQRSRLPCLGPRQPSAALGRRLNSIRTLFLYSPFSPLALSGWASPEKGPWKVDLDPWLARPREPGASPAQARAAGVAQVRKGRARGVLAGCPRWGGEGRFRTPRAASGGFARGMGSPWSTRAVVLPRPALSFFLAPAVNGERELRWLQVLTPTPGRLVPQTANNFSARPLISGSPRAILFLFLFLFFRGECFIME